MARGRQKEVAWLSIPAPVATTLPYVQFKFCFNSLLAVSCSCSPLSPILLLLFTPFLFPIPLILIPFLPPLLIPHFSSALIFSLLPCPTTQFLLCPSLFPTFSLHSPHPPLLPWLQFPSCPVSTLSILPWPYFSFFYPSWRFSKLQDSSSLTLFSEWHNTPLLTDPSLL